MIIAWAGLLVAVLTLLLALPSTATISRAFWPDETPLNLHDNRARDPHLRHLARILTSDTTTEAQRTIAELAEGLVTSPRIALFEGEASARRRLGSSVVTFAEEDPPHDHRQFLRRLGEVLERIERL